jgi:hypothetical protein
VNIAPERAAASVIDEKLSTLAKSSGGLWETACAVSMLADKTMTETKSGTRALSCMLGCVLKGFIGTGVGKCYV